MGFRIAFVLLESNQERHESIVDGYCDSLAETISRTSQQELVINVTCRVGWP